MKYYGIYNKKFDMYVSKFADDGTGCVMTNGFNDIAVWDEYAAAEHMRKDLLKADDYEVRSITDFAILNESDGDETSGIMTSDELPGFCEDLRRWEVSLILCAISGILDGELGVNSALGIKAEAEKVGAVRAFIEKKLKMGMGANEKKSG